MIELIIFDVDGTLAEAYSTNLLPGVKNFFQLVFQGGCPVRPKLALATNQGGVGMRYWMERDGFGKPDNYPSTQSIELRLKSILEQLGGDVTVPGYVSYRYQRRKGKWSPIPPGESDNPRWSDEWRKPNPGMLRQAMIDMDVTPEQTVFVGDSEADQVAARAARCDFQWASEFFALDWSDCANLERYFLKLDK